MNHRLGLSLLLACLLVQIISSFQPKSPTLSTATRPSSPFRNFSNKKPAVIGRSTHLKADISSAIAVADAVWQNSPYAAAALTCGVKASAADLVAQRRGYKKRQQEDSSKEIDSSFSSEESTDMAEKKGTDWRRNLAFLLYGAAYQGMAQEYLYNHMYPLLFGDGIGIRTVLSKVLFDLLIQTTFLTLPIAYMSKAIIYRYSFREAFRRYFDDIKNHGLLTKYFSLWGPVQCITFSVIPVHYRVTFIAFVSFFWLIVLSSIASRRQPSLNEEQLENQCSLVDGQTCNIDG